jgi:hypothetical protein
LFGQSSGQMSREVVKVRRVHQRILPFFFGR